MQVTDRTFGSNYGFLIAIDFMATGTILGIIQ